MKAIRVHRHGGPDVLSYEDIEIGRLGPDEVRVRNRAIGVNFVGNRRRLESARSHQSPRRLSGDGPHKWCLQVLYKRL